MKLNKKQREQVRLMFGGHCAYCGHPLGEKWHADHVEPVVRKLEFVRAEGRPTTMRTTGEAWYPERDHIGNMMPACVPCNIRKGGEDVESFRRGMERSIEVMRSNHSAYRHALRFGLIVEQPAKVVFHFERAAAYGVPAPDDVLLRERGWLQGDNLSFLDPYIKAQRGDGGATLDGSFSTEELEAIAAFMRDGVTAVDGGQR